MKKTRKTVVMVVACLLFAIVVTSADAALFEEDFSKPGGGAWWLRDGAEGWYAGTASSTTNAALADATNVLPGMSGDTSHYGYPYGGKSLHLVDGLAGALSGGNVVSIELSQVSRLGNCGAQGMFGFFTGGAIVPGGTWDEISYTGVPVLGGLKWGSRVAGVTTLMSYLGSSTAGASFDVQYDEVVRQRISLDPSTDKMKLEIKRYVGGVWGSYTTAIDWTAAGIDLSTANINGAYINAGRDYTTGFYYQQDDLVVIPEPATLVILALGGTMALIRKRKQA